MTACYDFDAFGVKHEMAWPPRDGYHVHLPMLDQFYADIVAGMRARPVWTSTVPVVSCPGCRTLRPDDGTACVRIVDPIAGTRCDTYMSPWVEQNKHKRVRLAVRGTSDAQSE